jgi:CheY-like chemotaxis protein
VKRKRYHRNSVSTGMRFIENSTCSNQDTGILERSMRGKNSKKCLEQVLLIDDDKNQSAVFEKILANAGYRVNSASGINEGLKSLKDLEVDIILCDLKMPEINAEQLITHIRKSPKHANIPIIIISANNRPELEMEMLANGADMLCDKKQAHKVLLSQIKMLLS